MRLLKLAFVIFISLYFMQAMVIAGPNDNFDVLVGGKFGNAVDISSTNRYVVIPLGQTMSKLPVTYQCWVKLNTINDYNIILSTGPKASQFHWEIYTTPTNGAIGIYIPQAGDFRSGVPLKIGEWHFIALRFEDKSLSLYVDGQKVIHKNVEKKLQFDASSQWAGKIEGEPLTMDGAIDDLKISLSTIELDGFVPQQGAEVDKDTVFLFNFDKINDESFKNIASESQSSDAVIKGCLSMPKGDRFLDEVQDELYAKTSLYGDKYIEFESKLPVYFVKAKRTGKVAKASEIVKLSLDGQWLLKGSRHRREADLETLLVNPEESLGSKEGWFKYGYDRSNWLKVHVPTSVQNAMVETGEIEDPFWDTNTWDELTEHGEPKIALHFRQTRIERQDWFFARVFELTDDWKDKAIRLYFDGIDIEGSVYLNGHSLGYHSGMFGGPEYDVTNIVYFDKPNELVVRIDAVPELWPGVLKGSPGWGWHYGHMISLGIWRSVELHQVPKVEIQSPFVKTESISEKKARLEIEYYVESSESQPIELQIEGVISGKIFECKPVKFKNDVTAYFGKCRYRTEISIDNPRLWWPANYGDPDMYSLQLTVTTEGQPIHTASTNFGIRTVKMLPLRGAQEATEYRWQFVINDVPMFIKGANWCWTDPMLRQEASKYEHILELARRGGIEMFRTWGGGIIESDIFYDKCDEKGLMVYQEFPYCWGPPDFPMTDPHMLDDQVTRVVKRLRNHPSLVMWGGGNENVAISGNDEGLLLVGKRCRQYDTTRPFHRTDPWGGSIHHWGVYHNGLPIESFDKMNQAFYGEFGGTSMTNWDESLRYLPEEKLNKWPPAQDDLGIQYHMHNFGYGDFAKQFKYCDYGPINDWKTYIDFSQLSQGDIIRYACNKQRSGSYFNMGGLWFYKLTELFPGHSWGVVGYYGYPKLSYYQAKHAYKAQAAFAHYSKFNWAADELFRASIHVNNDSSKPLKNVTVKAIIYGSDLKVKWSNTYDVDSVKTANRKVLDGISVTLEPEKMQPFLMAVSLQAEDGELLSDQWYWFNYQIKTEAKKKMEAIPSWGWPHDRAPEAFEAYGEKIKAPLLELPKTTLSASIDRQGSKGVITIKNQTDIPAFMVLIDNFPHKYGNFLGDTSFSMYPNETRKITFELRDSKESLDKLTVRAWNAPQVKIQ